jgi:hypothetical protein
MYQLTVRGVAEARIELVGCDGLSGIAKYSTVRHPASCCLVSESTGRLRRQFAIGAGSSYAITINGFDGSASVLSAVLAVPHVRSDKVLPSKQPTPIGDCLSGLAASFSTWDRDISGCGCVAAYKGGWWYTCKPRVGAACDVHEPDARLMCRLPLRQPQRWSARGRAVGVRRALTRDRTGLYFPACNHTSYGGNCACPRVGTRADSRDRPPRALSRRHGLAQLEIGEDARPRVLLFLALKRHACAA